jgi:multidrug efflux pump
MIAALIGSFMLYGKYGKGMVFFNEGETQFASIVIKSRGNLAADQISQLVNEVEARILDVRGLKSLNTGRRFPAIRDAGSTASVRCSSRWSARANATDPARRFWKRYATERRR